MSSSRVRHGVLIFVDRCLAWVPDPRSRARILKLLGATVGRNVRVHGIRLINLDQGLSNLILGDDVHVGAECLLDLKDQVRIGPGAVLGPRVMVLTHQDAGLHHGAPVADVIGTFERPTTVGEGAFIGAGATLLCGVDVGAHAVVGAGAVVTENVEFGAVVGGVPARRIGSITDQLLARGIRGPLDSTSSGKS